MKAWAYCRTSTTEQENGLEAQRQLLQKTCEAKGWDYELAEEHASGREMAHRPVFLGILGALRPGDRLCVTSLSRLSRSVIDFSNVLDRASREGWGIVVCDMDLDTTSPTGRLIARVIMDISQWEREEIGHRTRNAMAAMKAQGRTFGHPSAVPDEAKATIQALRARGLSLRACASELNAAGVPGPTGGRWYANSVRRHAGE